MEKENGAVMEENSAMADYEGQIIAGDEGFIALISPHISNNGVIEARLGKVVLASGEDVSLDFVGDGLINVVIEKEVLSEMTDAEGNPICELDVIEPGGSATLAIELDIPPSVGHGSQLTNTATVTSDTFDPDDSNNADSEPIIAIAVSNIGLEKSVISGEPIAGTQLTYQVEITNDGPSDVTGLVVSDTLPQGLLFVSSDDCTESEGTLTCNADSLVVDENKFIEYIVQLDAAIPSGTAITNAATISLDGINIGQTRIESTITTTTAAAMHNAVVVIVVRSTSTPRGVRYRTEGLPDPTAAGLYLCWY